MTFGRKIVTACAAALAIASLAVAAWAQAAAPTPAKTPKPPKAPPVVYSAEVNVCRASCGDTWVKARSCNDEAAACLAKADKSYRQCLPDCDAGKSPLSASFAWLAPKAPAASPIRRVAEPRQDDGPDSTAAVPWVDARTRWEALPSHTLVALPATFILPRSAYGYAGFSQEIRPFVLQAPGLLKVEVVVIEGQVGVALATPTGSALVSKEAALKPSTQVQTAYFEIGPQTPPVSLLVRNYDAGGAPGSVTVRSVAFARAKVLPAGEAERLGALK